MKKQIKNSIIFLAMFILLLMVGFLQSWNVCLSILNLCIISAIMTMGVNIQWGFGGLFNAGVMGFTALGGLCAVIVSMPPVYGALNLGGSQILLGFISLILTFLGLVITRKIMRNFKILKNIVTLFFIILFFIVIKFLLNPGIDLIESFEPAKTGYLGGFGLPIISSWIAGGFLAAFIAWIIAKASLGLRSDYLAIATLGISEILIYFLKNEDWLTRGVKNVTGLPRPVPYEINLQNNEFLKNFVVYFDLSLIETSSIIVKLCYIFLFSIVLIIIYIFAEKARKSPWGRMMRAIRDNEEAAGAMGKNVNFRHLQIFVIGSAIIGIAGAMLTTLDGQFTPSSYTPMRFTFLIWVMVIVGGSGNNLGSIIGGFLIWFFWIQSEPIGNVIIQFITREFPISEHVKNHIINHTAFLRFIAMGLVLLFTLRFSPRGLIPEENK